MVTTKASARELNRIAGRIGEDVVKVGRNAWLAGLGAVATVEERAKSLLDELVAKGESFEKESELGKRLQPAAERVRRTVEPAVNTVKKAGSAVEQQIQRTVSETLHRLGIPTRDEIGTLINRVEKLTRKVEELQKAS
ncbi:MAG: hypothetical protein D6718_00075 [Acidobacteria bacterium]|nr:MAG: hypothetical protein D6718_00075 [Acidobacteriota bacterium]